MTSTQLIKENIAKYKHSLITWDTSQAVGVDNLLAELEVLLQSFTTTLRQSVLEEVRERVIKENEWEDPDIRDSDYFVTSKGGRDVFDPWVRNHLRKQQRTTLDEMEKEV